MNQEIVGIKQLYQELPRITRAVARGKSFVVVKHAKPVFRIEPIEPTGHAARYTLNDLRNLQFSGGHKNLSKTIDTLLYGAS